MSISKERLQKLAGIAINEQFKPVPTPAQREWDEEKSEWDLGDTESGWNPAKDEEGWNPLDEDEWLAEKLASWNPE